MTTISTSDLSRLPLPEMLKRLFQSLAMLDAVMSPEWEYRYFSFDAHWHAGETMGSMRNGSGDDLFALFLGSGCFLKGFSHEHRLNDLSSDEFYRSVSIEFTSAVTEPAFSPELVTFCCWCLSDGVNWQHVPVNLQDTKDADGSNFILSGLDGRPETYKNFAQDHYEQSIPLEAIAAIFDHKTLTADLVKALNHEIELPDLQEDIVGIDYPV